MTCRLIDILKLVTMLLYTYIMMQVDPSQCQWFFNYMLLLCWWWYNLSRYFIILKIAFINNHCVKSVQIQSFFWTVFSRIQYEQEKTRTRKKSVFGHFLRSTTFCTWRSILLFSSHSLLLPMTFLLVGTIIFTPTFCTTNSSATTFLYFELFSSILVSL